MVGRGARLVVAILVVAAAACGGGSGSSEAQIEINYVYSGSEKVDELMRIQSEICHNRVTDTCLKEFARVAKDDDGESVTCAHSPFDGERLTVRDADGEILFAGSAPDTGELRALGSSMLEDNGMACRYVVEGVEIPDDADFIEVEALNDKTVFSRDEFDLDSGVVALTVGGE